MTDTDYRTAKKPKRFSRRKKILAVFLLIVLITGGALLWHKHTNDQKAGKNAAVISAEKKANEAFNKKLQNSKKSNGSSSQSSGSSSDLQVANVVLVSATANEVRGYVSNVLEDGGTCTTTFTNGSQKVTRSSKGFIDVNKTTCLPIAINGLSPGEWSVVLNYKSSTASGNSEQKMVSVE